MLLPSSFPPQPHTQTSKQLYRRFLQHLRLLPDPHIWSILIPRFKQLLKKSSVARLDENDSPSVIPPAESSRAASERIRQWKREKVRKKAERELQRLRAAVACHPHALTRLIEESYGQRGVLRHELLGTISSPYSSKPSRDPLPPPLLPLRPAPPAPSEAQPRARKTMPPCRVRADLRRSMERDWALVKPPLSIQHSPIHGEKDIMGPSGWEGRGVIANLRVLSGFDTTFSLHSNQMSKLDLTALSPHIRRLFPMKSQPSLREPPLSPPRPKATRQNPHMWGLPRRLDKRLLSRTYRRFWDGLVWVRPEGGTQQDKWTKCSYEETIEPHEGPMSVDIPTTSSSKKATKKGRGASRIEADRWSQATDDDVRWISLDLDGYKSDAVR
ncbi:hypothetical protein I302_108349 [Kwoniella bestiolae CBS 10118]|uniref:LYR motif-containing protein Cup1-like N-terminal domain-containing protein n=1 Tax=Kwoniella bestiolae CBS 10118 TaxID=1296100 RepID=A0A1B9FVY3_9TREE|nr:hypothetical protein I302_07278 [Kwoniella bestiolae CBS 10118]OCF22928.1 hypothetical protein I302_07278 [Kwoniella bestiolae CBS 10118]